MLVTTSYVNEQAYKEVRDDGHHIIIIIAGANLVATLKTAAIGTAATLKIPARTELSSAR